MSTISGCSYCTIKGKYSNLSKTVYLNHRSFLPPVDIDILRQTQADKDFPSKALPLPEAKTMKYVDKANGMFTGAKKKEDKDLLLQETGCKGPYSL